MKLQKTKIAKAVESESSSSELFSPLEQSSESIALDSFVQETIQAESDEIESIETGEDEEGQSENLTLSDDDAYIYAATGVDYFEKGLTFGFGRAVALPDNAKQDLTEKAAPVVKKYLKAENIPSFFVKFKDEISLGVAVGAVVYGVYKESKASKKSESKAKVGESFPLTASERTAKSEHNPPFTASPLTNTDDLEFRQ